MRNGGNKMLHEDFSCATTDHTRQVEYMQVQGDAIQKAEDLERGGTE